MIYNFDRIEILNEKKYFEDFWGNTIVIYLSICLF